MSREEYHQQNCDRFDELMDEIIERSVEAQALVVVDRAPALEGIESMARTMRQADISNNIVGAPEGTTDAPTPDGEAEEE